MRGALLHILCTTMRTLRQPTLRSGARKAMATPCNRSIQRIFATAAPADIRREAMLRGASRPQPTTVLSAIVLVRSHYRCAFESKFFVVLQNWSTVVQLLCAVVAFTYMVAHSPCSAAGEGTYVQCKVRPVQRHPDWPCVWRV